MLRRSGLRPAPAAMLTAECYSETRSSARSAPAPAWRDQHHQLCLLVAACPRAAALGPGEQQEGPGAFDSKHPELPRLIQRRGHWPETEFASEIVSSAKPLLLLPDRESSCSTRCNHLYRQLSLEVAQIAEHMRVTITRSMSNRPQPDVAIW